MSRISVLHYFQEEMIMNTYSAVRNRLAFLLNDRHMSIHKLSLESSVPPSTIKNILYGKSVNPGIVTLKMLCDGLKISLPDFFDNDDFRALDLEI